MDNVNWLHGKDLYRYEGQTGQQMYIRWRCYILWNTSIRLPENCWDMKTWKLSLLNDNASNPCGRKPLKTITDKFFCDIPGGKNLKEILKIALLKVTRPSFLGGYHPSLKLSGIPAFTFIVSLTHRMDNI